MERTRCRWVDNNLHRGRAVAGYDREPAPTNPLGGKLLARPLVQRNQIASQVKVQNPSVRQAATVISEGSTKMQCPAPCPRETHQE